MARGCPLHTPAREGRGTWPDSWQHVQSPQRCPSDTLSPQPRQRTPSKAGTAQYGCALRSPRVASWGLALSRPPQVSLHFPQAEPHSRSLSGGNDQGRRLRTPGLTCCVWHAGSLFPPPSPSRLGGPCAGLPLSRVVRLRQGRAGAGACVGWCRHSLGSARRARQQDAGSPTQLHVQLGGQVVTVFCKCHCWDPPLFCGRK